jgi:hypothetical protein
MPEPTPYRPDVKPLDMPATTGVTHAEPVPPAIATAAAEQDLGGLVRVYVPRRVPQWIAVLLLVVCIALIWCIFPIYVLWKLLRSPSLNSRLASRRAYVFDRGLVIGERSAPLEVWRWADVTTMFQKILVRNEFGMWTGGTVTYTLTRTDGRTLALADFWADVEKLGQHVNVQVAGTQLPRMRSAISQGQGVQFGDVTLDGSGITGPKARVAWVDVEEVGADSAYLRVTARGKRVPVARTHITRIPNPTLFLALAKRLRDTAQQG